MYSMEEGDERTERNAAEARSSSATAADQEAVNGIQEVAAGSCTTKGRKAKDG